jgi:hypothetical protein
VLPAWNVTPLREYSSGAVPPDAVTVIVVVPPLHNITGPAAEAVMAEGAAAMVNGVVAVHKLASLTVIV